MNPIAWLNTAAVILCGHTTYTAWRNRRRRVALIALALFLANAACVVVWLVRP